MIAGAPPAGKLNDDARDDLAIGAPLADTNPDSSGKSYVVFGSDQPWSGALNLSTLNGANGFTLNGVAEGDCSGLSIGMAGDVNGDGRGDLLIGAPGNPLGTTTGVAYLVFGDTGVESDVIFASGFE